MVEESAKLVHNLDTKTEPAKVKLPTLIVVLLLMLVLGAGGGYLLATSFSGSSSTVGSSKKADGKTTVGVFDKKKFPDKAEGKLKEGGIDGEGNFHLERPGGESQNVYLTSSIVDLSAFVGKKIRVWGETFQGEKAGWLMDVGYVEVL